MLFKMNGEAHLTPVPFFDFGDQQKLERDLEGLLAENLFSTLFERSPLLPFHRSRPLQAEGDIYALDQKGDLVIFELKRSLAGSGALDQLFRYVTVCATWSYSDLERKYRTHVDEPAADLRQAHQEAFYLDAPLSPDSFNRQQHMWVVGSAADDGLVRAVDLWKAKGLPIEFFPYRIYELGGEFYFEFFAKPHDLRVNPGKRKGVLFDTNRTWDEDSLRSMCEQGRVSAYGDRKDAVASLSPGDLVFYSHKGVGVVGAAQVVGREIRSDRGGDERYWDVKWLTPLPTRFDRPKAMSFGEVKQVTGKNFFWARIQKVPYLTQEEAEQLLQALTESLTG